MLQYNSFHFTVEAAPKQLLCWKANGDVSSYRNCCQYLKMLCLDPTVPATVITEQKTEPTGKQTPRQEATATPVPQGKVAPLNISLLSGLLGSPLILLLLCLRRGMKADWKKKWGNFAGVFRELLQWEGRHGRKPEPSSCSPNGTWRSQYQHCFIPTGMLQLLGALHSAASR